MATSITTMRLQYPATESGGTLRNDTSTSVIRATDGTLAIGPGASLVMKGGPNRAQASRGS
jgi:hypothetical protein